mgnify:CR=1 FL=1
MDSTDVGLLLICAFGLTGFLVFLFKPGAPAPGAVAAKEPSKADLDKLQQQADQGAKEAKDAHDTAVQDFEDKAKASAPALEDDTEKLLKYLLEAGKDVRTPTEKDR